MGMTAAERQRRSRRHRSGDHSMCSPERCGPIPLAGGESAPVLVCASPAASAGADGTATAPPELAAAVVQAPTDPVAADAAVVRRLGPRGRRLWDEVQSTVTGAARVLLEEACRVADRLDKLADYLDGREDVWCRFHARNEDGSVVEVVIDAALAEARQQATALKLILADLRSSSGSGKAGSSPAKTGVSGRDELKARREDRRAAAQGRQLS